MEYTETYAVRIYGERDLRLEKFNLPPIKPNEILFEIYTNSICFSSYKAAQQGAKHKRIPKNIDKEPTIIGHEFCGIILKVGEEYKGKWFPGQKCTIQPAINYKKGPVGILSAPGYSYKYIGGNATKVIIPEDVLIMDCLLEYNGDSFYKASLAEPLSCIIGAVNSHYHIEVGKYKHIPGIRIGGTTVILGGAGPMGLLATSYFINTNSKPGLLIIADINDERLKRAKELFSPKVALKKGVRLEFINSLKINIVEYLSAKTNGKMADDVFVMVPNRKVVETGQELMGFEGTLNFFAGPADKNFTAQFNFYDVHYNYHKIVGSSGGNVDDLREALKLISNNIIDPSFMVSHIGGLDSVIDTVLNLPSIPGAKKLIYTQKSFPLTAINKIEQLKDNGYINGESINLLVQILQNNNYLWSAEAEEFILKYAEPIRL
ncbi:MAG: zinc-binding dehydrogenase [Candidatus Marinimicrobia bacterium]|nr:zinc-binding dehydrogenase [Candidatus Neomarinimicrobiota bacterium]